jgi:predicted Rossmann-fold nucleotide-binding protein
LLDWLRNTMAAERKIELTDMDLFTVTDSPEDTVAALVAARQQLLETEDRKQV